MASRGAARLLLIGMDAFGRARSCDTEAGGALDVVPLDLGVVPIGVSIQSDRGSGGHVGSAFASGSI